MTIHLLPHADPTLGTATLTALVDSLDASSAAIDQDGRIVGLTQAWHTYAGQNPFLAGQDLGCDYRQTCQGLTQSSDGGLSIVALGLVGVLEGRLPRLTLDFPFTEADGPHDFGCTAIARPEGGPIRAVIHLRDISQRAALERRMRRSERLFKATTDAAMDLVCLVDTGGHLAYHNPALVRFLGPTAPDLGDLDLATVIHEADRAQYREALREGARNGLTKPFEFRIPHAKGGWVELEGQVSAVEDPGTQGGTVLLIARDISLRKQLERDREQAEVQERHSQKLEAIGQLAAGIAHEINTPTQYIGDNTSFLREACGESMALIRTLQAHLEKIRAGASPAEEAEKALATLEGGDIDYLEAEIPKAIQQTLEGVARVTKIVAAMKDFSHAGGESATTLDLHRALESTITVSRGEWKHLAELTTEFDPDLPLVVGYPGEINQVILNLIVNAAHAIEAAQAGRSDGAPGLIRVGTRRHASEVEFWVADNGTGIPPEIQRRIFDPFFTTKVVGKGTGQGLSIVHAVVTVKHKGRIELDSTVGQGSTFRIFLPLTAASA